MLQVPQEQQKQLHPSHYLKEHLDPHSKRQFKFAFIQIFSMKIQIFLKNMFILIKIYFMIDTIK